jgi:hypothetical protein
MEEKVSPSRIALPGSEESGAFTFSMNVLDTAHVHFAGATWPTTQVEKKMDAMPTGNPWKRRLMVMMKVDAAERKNVKHDRSILNAYDACADPNQESDVRNKEGITRGEMDRSVERRTNAEMLVRRRDLTARLDRAVREWIDHSVKRALWQFSVNWAEAARVAEREKMLERVKARKTKRDADRAVLVRCCRQVTNRGNMQRLLTQFARNLTAGWKQSRDFWAAVVLEEADRATLIKAREVDRAALIKVSGGLARVVSSRNMRSAVLQFGANWTVAVMLAVEQKEVEQWLREATVSGGLVRALDRRNMRSAVLQFKTAAVLHMCSGERIEGQEEMKVKDEKQRWSGKKGAGLEQNGCATVLSRVCSGTAGQQTAREERKEGITGQALMRVSADEGSMRDGLWPGGSTLMRFSVGLARWRSNREMLLVLMQIGGNFSAARRMIRRKKKDEKREGEVEAVRVTLDALLWKYKLGSVRADEIRAKVQELRVLHSWVALDWVEELLLQVKSIRAIIKGFVMGVKKEGLRTAVQQLRAGADEWMRVSVARGCCVRLAELGVVAAAFRCVRRWCAAVTVQTAVLSAGADTGRKKERRKKKKKKKNAAERAPSAPCKTGSGRLEGRLRRSKTPWEAWESLKKDEFGADKSGAAGSVPKIRCDR